MKEHTLRTLATSNSTACCKKTKQFREKLVAYVKLKRKAAKKWTVIPSCTSEGKTYYKKKKTVYCLVIIVTFMITNSRQDKHELLVWRVPCFLIMCKFYHINLLQNNDDHNDDDDDIITLHFFVIMMLWSTMDTGDHGIQGLHPSVYCLFSPSVWTSPKCLFLV